MRSVPEPGQSDIGEDRLGDVTTCRWTDYDNSYRQHLGRNDDITGWLIKVAMISIDGEITRQRLRSRMLLQVHDELVFEVPTDKLDEARALIEKEMTQAADLRCGLAVEVHSGTSWAEAHA